METNLSAKTPEATRTPQEIQEETKVIYGGYMERIRDEVKNAGVPYVIDLPEKDTDSRASRIRPALIFIAPINEPNPSFAVLTENGLQKISKGPEIETIIDERLDFRIRNGREYVLKESDGIDGVMDREIIIHDARGKMRSFSFKNESPKMVEFRMIVESSRRLAKRKIEEHPEIILRKKAQEGLEQAKVFSSFAEGLFPKSSSTPPPTHGPGTGPIIM